MSSQVTQIGLQNVTGPFRIITSTVTADATGGIVQANASAKFGTGVPLDKVMMINQITWHAFIKANALFAAGTKEASWQILGQLTEALARTSVAQTDPTFIDNYADEIDAVKQEISAVGEVVVVYNRQKAQWIHVFANPWLTVAQNLVLIQSIVPGSVSAACTGPKVDMFLVIEYFLADLDSNLRALLANRIQISGQA